MNILFGVSHPKHVYVFKNVINNLLQRGHEIKIIAVDKEITSYLLKKFNLPYTTIGKNQPKFYKKILALPGWEYLTYRISKEFEPDIFIGRALPHFAHVSAIMGKPFIIFEDTEIARALHRITVPFANAIVTPESFKENFGKKHIRFNGIFESGYLHPLYFKPDLGVLKELGLKEGERYIILRFVTWGAHHDIGQSGISSNMKKEYISTLEKYGRIFISSESELSPEFKKYELKIAPEKFHSLLSHAHLYLGEGGSIATEAAILGTPSIHISTTAKSCGIFDDMLKYNLVYTFDDDLKALQKALEILNDTESKAKWIERKNLMLKEKIDVTRFMTDLIENYPDSIYNSKLE